MAKTSQLRAFFGGGEQDPRLSGRVDRQKNLVALALCENFFPTPIGGLEYRPGLRLRRVLFSQRHPDRVKMVRAPGYTGAAERILILDGSNDVGKIEVYAFPYAGNTRFTLTDIWSRSENRPATVDPNVTEHRNPIPANIHEARVSYGDYAGTIMCHQDFPPLHVGSATITNLASTDVTLIITLSIDAITNQLWQISARTPQASEDLGRMPSTFSNVGGMTQDGRDVLALTSVTDANALWNVNRSNARLSKIEGILNVTGRVTGFANFNGNLYCVTNENMLWIVDRRITSRCMNLGEVTAVPANETLQGLTQHEDELLGIDSAGGLIMIDVSTPGSSSRRGAIDLTLTGPPYPEVLSAPKSIASNQGQLIVTMATGSERSDVLLALDSNSLDTTLIGYLPLDLLDNSAMTTIEVVIGPYDRLGDLYDERTERSANEGTGDDMFFTPKNYIDQLGNRFGEGGYPACATAFLNRMVMGGSRYLPGTFIGSELFPRPAADIGGDVNQQAYNAVFNGIEGPAVAVYNFYWLYHHPRKAAARTWEPNTAHDSFSYKIAAERELHIIWMVSYNNYLVIGTSQGVWIARDLAPDTPPELTQYANIPCGDVDPVITDFGIAYTDAARREVHIANLGIGFEPPHRLNLLADARHITEGTRIRQLAWQATPQRRLWLLTEAGTLAALCYEPDSDPPVLGWVRVTNRALRFCGVCVIPGEDYQVACVLAYASAVSGLTTLYLTTLDGRDHVDIGVGRNFDFTDDALVPPRDPGLGAVVRPPPILIPVRPPAPTPPRPGPPVLPPVITPPVLPPDEDLVVEIEPISIVDVGQTITLVARANPGDDVSYAWSVHDGPGTIVSGGNIGPVDTAEYTAPDTYDENNADVIIRVIATRLTDTAMDDEGFPIRSPTAPPPPLTVTITDVQSVMAGDVTEIRATADPLDDVTYAWSIRSGPGEIFGTGRTAEYTAPDSVLPNTYAEVQVVATRQGATATATDVFLITEAGTEVTFSVSIFIPFPDVDEGQSTFVSATASGDAPGETSFTWSKNGVGTLTHVPGSSTDETSVYLYTAPDDVAADQNVEITVVASRTDPSTGEVRNRSDSGIVTVRDESTIDPDPEDPPLTVSVNSTFHGGLPFCLTLDRWDLEAVVGGTATGDITYRWTAISGPGSFSNTNQSTTTWSLNCIRLPGTGTSVVELTVTRGGHTATVSEPLVLFP